MAHVGGSQKSRIHVTYVPRKPILKTDLSHSLNVRVTIAILHSFSDPRFWGKMGTKTLFETTNLVVLATESVFVHTDGEENLTSGPISWKFPVFIALASCCINWTFFSSRIFLVFLMSSPEPSFSRIPHICLSKGIFSPLTHLVPDSTHSAS